MNRIFVYSLVALILAGCQPKSGDDQGSAAVTPDRTEASAKLTARAVALLTEKQYHDAVAALDGAIKMDPTNQDPYLILGQVLLQAGEYQRAADFLDTAAKNFPNNGMIFYMLGISNKMAGKKLPAALSARRSFEIYKNANDEESAARSAALLQQILSMPDGAAGQTTKAAPKAPANP